MATDRSMSKVPAVTLVFWVIKVIATTLGETGGDAVSMTLNWGYALSSMLFIGIFVVAVAAQIAARRFRPVPVLGRDHRDHDSRHDDGGFRRPLAWHRIPRRVADPVVLSDGVAWRLVLAVPDLIAVDTVASPKIETFYWTADPVLANSRHCTRRLDGRLQRPRLRARRAGLCGAALVVGRSGIFLHQHFAHPAVLGRVHSDAAIRCDRRDFLDKPVCDWRPGDRSISMHRLCSWR